MILGGDGADELLAGYPTFVAERRRSFPAAAAAARRLPARPPGGCPWTIAISASTSSSSSFSGALLSQCHWLTSAGWDLFPGRRSPSF